MARHLITGVAGFVGSHLAEKLLERDNEVWGVDSLVCGFRGNISELQYNQNFHFVEQDIREISRFAFAPGSIDYVWHLAARGEVYWCRDNPEEAVDININGTLNVLEIAKTAKCKHFFFEDTSAEYDSFDEEQHYPTAEWMAPNTITPMGYYPITKMAASQFVRSFGKKHDFGTTLFRYTNIYGPSMNLERDIPPVVGAFTSKLLNDECPIIYGDGNKKRDFLYIGDLTGFHLAALRSRGLKGGTKTYNAGSVVNYSINEVYCIVHEACEKIKNNIPCSVEYKPDQPDEAQVTLANIDKTKKDMLWIPTTSFEVVVERTVESLAKMMDKK